MNLVPTARDPKTAVRPERQGPMMAVPTAAPMKLPIPMAALTGAQTKAPTRMAAQTAVQTKAPSRRSVEARVSESLLRLIGLSLPDFNAGHWGRSPILHRASARTGSGFADLFSCEAVDELLSRRGLRTPFLRMTRNGDAIPAARYTRSAGVGAEISDQVADDKALAEFAAGGTLVLQGLHRTWRPLQDFAGHLAADLGHPVQVNAYITPPMSQGLTPHYDVHDVFLVQFAGRKHWRVHEPVLISPLREQQWQTRAEAVKARSCEQPILDVILEDGDVLYLPRGYIHAATSLDEISGHLTIGVHPVTRHAIVEQIFATTRDDAALRQSLPAGLDMAAPETLDEEFAVTIAALRAALERIDRTAILQGIGRNLAAATRPQPLSPLAQFTTAASLTPATRVRLRPGLHVALRADDAHCILQLPDKEIRLPRDAADALRAVTTGTVLTAETLPSLDVGPGLRLLSDLLRAGVLVPA